MDYGFRGAVLSMYDIILAWCFSQQAHARAIDIASDFSNFCGAEIWFSSTQSNVRMYEICHMMYIETSASSIRKDVRIKAVSIPKMNCLMNIIWAACYRLRVSITFLYTDRVIIQEMNISIIVTSCHTRMYNHKSSNLKLLPTWENRL